MDNKLVNPLPMVHHDPGALTHTVAVAMPVMCMPVLFQEISEDLGLSLVQIGSIWGLMPFRRCSPV